MAQADFAGSTPVRVTPAHTSGLIFANRGASSLPGAWSAGRFEPV